MFGIRHLIAPLQLDRFIDTHLSHCAVYIQGDADKFGGLFGWQDITHTLNYSGVGYPTVRFVHEKQSLPAEALRRADHWLKQGATLLINYVQNFDPVVERFANVLAAELNAPVNINSYTSWPAKQGFDVHYDRHDVFIIQLAGTKAWKVFEPTLKHPIERQQGELGPPPDNDPYLECDMSVGDVLYIPRGHWHYAVSVTPCVHFTVGVTPRSGIDFLAWLTEQWTEGDAFLRRDFPLLDAAELGGQGDRPHLAEHVARFRKHLIDALQDDALLDRLLQYCMVTNPIQRRFRLPEYVELAESIDRDTSFVPHPDQKVLYQHDSTTGSGAALVRGHLLQLTDVPRELIDFVFQHESAVSGNSLRARFPDLKWSKTRRFLLTLYEHGVLLLAEDTE